MFIFLPVAAPMLIITWLPKRNQPADMQSQTKLTLADSPLWPEVLVSFPLMASVSALTLPCDSSLQQFHPQQTTGWFTPGVAAEPAGPELLHNA